MTTIIATSASAYIKSIHGQTTSGVTANQSEVFKYQLTLYKYQYLYDSVITQLNTYIRYFSIGNFTELTKNFTTKSYNTLLMSAKSKNFDTSDINNLVNFVYNPTKFELMRESTYRVIDGLEKTIKLVNQNTTYQKDITELTKYKNILDDPKLLIEYIDSQRLNTMPLFQATETFQVQYLLKPWFEAYLQTYGPPPNGVFESDKLAEIVIKLVSDGIITEDDFING
jgi:hypothetical protein